MTTIKNIIILAKNALKAAKIPNFSLEAEILASWALKMPRERLLVHDEVIPATRKNQAFQRLINRRIAGEPVAYLTGHKEFYGLDFLVNKNVLIPRPETELIVDEVLKILSPQPSTLVIDIGTGSGCIVVALATKIKDKKSQPEAGQPLAEKIKFIGIDISTKALAVAKKNAKLNKVDNLIKFYKSDLLNNLKIKNFKLKNLIITANLPYLTPTQINHSPTIAAEPRLALDGGQDGLKYYRQLFSQIKKARFPLLTRRGTKGEVGESTSIVVLCEIDPSQVTTMKKLVKKCFPRNELTIKKDLAKHNRLAIIRI